MIRGMLVTVGVLLLVAFAIGFGVGRSTGGDDAARKVCGKPGCIETLQTVVVVPTAKPTAPAKKPAKPTPTTAVARAS